MSAVRTPHDVVMNWKVNVQLATNAGSVRARNVPHGNVLMTRLVSTLRAAVECNNNSSKIALCIGFQ